MVASSLICLALTEATKICVKCTELKTLSEFTKNASKKDGVSAYCKPCDRDSKNKWNLKKFPHRVEIQATKALRSTQSDLKFCPKCETSKPFTDFRGNSSRKDRIQAYCILCETDYQRQWRSTPKYRLYARAKQRRGFTQEQADALLQSQGNVCAICGTATPGHKRTWSMDHDHVTGVVRGMLCHPCNIGLGAFRDNLTSLSKAIQYLERAKSC
jgi:hypothetical protein